MAPIPEWRAILMKKPDLAPLKEPYIHESCQNELDGMYKDQLTQTVLKRQTEKRLKFFYQHENDFFRYQDFFEPIAKISDGEKVIQYYSWRYNNVRALGNLRILFVVLKLADWLDTLPEPETVEEIALCAYSDAIDEIAMALAEFRVKHNMTQTELAKHLGFSQSVLSEYESGSRNISLKNACELMAKIGKSISVTIENVTLENVDKVDETFFGEYTISNEEPIWEKAVDYKEVKLEASAA